MTERAPSNAVNVTETWDDNVLVTPEVVYGMGVTDELAPKTTKYTF